jgi:hypothetical protein
MDFLHSPTEQIGSSGLGSSFRNRSSKVRMSGMIGTRRVGVQLRARRTFALWTISNTLSKSTSAQVAARASESLQPE